MFTFTMLIDGFDDCEVFSAPKQRGRFDAVIVGTERDTDLEEQEAATAEAPIVPACSWARPIRCSLIWPHIHMQALARFMSKTPPPAHPKDAPIACARATLLRSYFTHRNRRRVSSCGKAA